MQTTSATPIATRAPISETTFGECSLPGHGLDENIRVISNRAEDLAHAIRDFAAKTKHLTSIEGQQLRLKGNSIKPAQYRGLNPVKHVLRAIGVRSHAYDKQMRDLRATYHLPQHTRLELEAISGHLKDLAKAKVCDLRKELALLQDEMARYAPSCPALQAQVDEAANKSQYLNQRLDQLHAHLSSLHAESDKADEGTNEHQRIGSKQERIIEEIDFFSNQAEEIKVKAKQADKSYNELRLLSEDIVSKQRDIQELISTLYPPANHDVDPDISLAILATRSGKEAIDHSLDEGCDAHMDAADILEDLKSLHLEAGTEFSLSSIQELQLKHAADDLSSHETLNEQFTSMYLEAWKPYEDYPQLEPYRKITYTATKGSVETQQELLSKMASNEALGFSTPLQTYDSLQDFDFRDTNIIYEVHGSSMRKAVTALLPAVGYSPRNVFFPMATFTVEDARLQDGRLKVRLVEQFLPPMAQDMGDDRASESADEGLVS
jgi:hypothetical protein